jgi:hypothetical protein
MQELVKYQRLQQDMDEDAVSCLGFSSLSWC